MKWTLTYPTAKQKLLKDASICAENRKLFNEFLAYQEYNLKRSYGMPTLDDHSARTLAS